MKKITFLSLIFLNGVLLSFGQYLEEGFESSASIPAGWNVNQVNADETWNINSSPALAHSGDNYAVVVYDPNLNTQDESLVSPSIDLSSATNPRLIFWWNTSYYWSVSPYDNYDFTVSIDDGTNVTEVFTENDETDFDDDADSFIWFRRTVDLSSWIGQTNVKIIFNYQGVDGASLSVDQILVEETPSCEAPSGVSVTVNSLTEVTISWAAGASETEWTYEYGETGFTIGSGTSATVTTTSVDLSGLTEQVYDIYVKANCSGGEDSSWTDVVTWIMPPQNDDISGAIPITPSPEGTGCNSAGFTLNFSSDGTTDSGLDGSCNDVNTGLDQFFIWTATTGGLLWNDATPGNPGIIVRDISGNEITCAGTFAPDNTVLSGWEIGDDLIIQIYDFGTSVSDVAFCLEEYTPPAPIIPNYSENFDTYLPSLWTEASGDYGDPSGTTSTFVGGDFVNDTSNPNGRSARINIYGTDVDEYLISPEFNLSGGTYYLNFDIGLVEYNATLFGTLGSDDYVALLVTQDNGTNWTELTRWDASTAISNTGQSVQEIELSGYGDTVQFAYYAFSDTSNEDNDFFIDNFQITTATLSSADESIEGFKLYPTIVEQDLNFSALEHVQRITIYNLLGQEVFKTTPNVSNSSINLSTLNEGIYMVKVQVGNTTSTYKIIKK